MKKTILILISVIMFATPTMAKTCKDTYKEASYVMHAHQQGIDKPTLVRMAKESFEGVALDIGLLIIDAAYKKKIWPDKADKDTMVEEFSMSVYKVCVDQQWW